MNPQAAKHTAQSYASMGHEHAVPACITVLQGLTRLMEAALRHQRDQHQIDMVARIALWIAASMHTPLLTAASVLRTSHQMVES